MFEHASGSGPRILSFLVETEIKLGKQAKKAGGQIGRAQLRFDMAYCVSGWLDEDGGAARARTGSAPPGCEGLRRAAPGARCVSRSAPRREARRSIADAGSPAGWPAEFLPALERFLVCEYGRSMVTQVPNGGSRQARRADRFRLTRLKASSEPSPTRPSPMASSGRTGRPVNGSVVGLRTRRVTATPRFPPPHRPVTW